MRTEKYSPQLLQEIKDQIYLPDLVQKYSHLNRQNKGLCPFHKEDNPSFSVKGEHWHCFGCGKKVDCFAFIMEVEHLTFPSAVKLLAFETGIRLPESDSVKKIVFDKWQEKKKNLDRLDYLESLFKDYENAIYSLKRFEMKCLPSKEKRDATRAVQVAYPNIKTYGSQRTTGSILLTKDNIHDRLLEALNNNEVTPEYVIKGLKEIVENGSKTEKTKALRTIAEIMGLIGKGVIATQVNVGQEPLFSKEEEEEYRRIRGTVLNG